MKRLTAEQVASELLREADEYEMAFRRDCDRLDYGAKLGMRRAAEMIRDNLIESDDERRARFERWYRDSFGGSSPSFNETQLMWMAWNAALDFRGDA